MRWNIALILYCLTSLHSAWASDITLSIGSHKINAVIANTTELRTKGLMNTSSLCHDCGMLFAFPQTAKHRFWMKNTPISLAIAFIDANGKILETAEMKANTLQIYTAQQEYLYALEMKKGWFTDHAIKANDHVHGLDKTPQIQ